MTPVAQQEEVQYVVLPRMLWEKRVQQHVPTLRVLRAAISRAWKGHSAVDEIRAQRHKQEYETRD